MLPKEGLLRQNHAGFCIKKTPTIVRVLNFAIR